MTAVTLEELGEYRSAALEEIVKVISSTETILNRLKEGIELREASDLIDLLWDAYDGERLKTKLLSDDPKGNGNMLSYAGLDKKHASKITLNVTQAFFLKLNEYIVCQLKDTLTKINGMGLQSEEGIEAMTDLRRQVARYCGFLNWGIYDIREQLLAANPTQWSDLKSTTETVENGDFLFLEDLGKHVTEVQDEFVKDRLNIDGWCSLDNIKYRYENIQGATLLGTLFSKYLKDLV